MKNFLSVVILLLISINGHSQDATALGHSYEEILEHHKATGGVKTPKTTIDEKGNKHLFYDCTDDRGMGMLFFSYSFKQNICDVLCIAIHNNLDYLQDYLNKKYQYDDSKVWFDNKNNVIINLTGDKELYFVWYRPKYITK